jgi:hypothetical protein
VSKRSYQTGVGLDGEDGVVDNEIAEKVEGDEVNERLENQEKSGKSNCGAGGCDERERLFSFDPLERDRVLALEGLR